VDKKLFHANPIAVAEYMTTTDEYWYCPFAYGYSNYSREGYARHTLTYTDLVQLNGHRLRSTIGGTGLAISAHSHQPKIALAFAEWIVSPAVQSTLYVEHGGQPGHRQAWIDPQANRLTRDYFYCVLPAMERGYMRPRYDGYLYFQDHGGDPIQEFLLKKRDIRSTLANLDQLYRESLTRQPTPPEAVRPVGLL
jgi:multiple sugar transport system substrate-binding protein